MRPTRVDSAVGCATSAVGEIRSAPASRPAAVALRTGGETARLPGAAQEVGGGEDIRVAGTSAEAGQGLRAIAADRSGHDLLGHEPNYAPQACQRGRLKCLKKGL